MAKAEMVKQQQLVVMAKPLANGDRAVTLTNENTWNGVTSAGVTMSWDAELAEVSDDSPTVAAAQVPTYTAAGLVQASFQAFGDISGLASDVLMLFADARDRLEAAAHATGSGSAQPTGIFTAITGSQAVVSTTAATIGLVDLQAVKRALTPRFRNQATWVMAPVYGDAIKTLGTALSASYTNDLTEANTSRLLGRPVVETDDAPTTQTTTVKDAEIIFGDFSQFVTASWGGMEIGVDPYVNMKEGLTNVVLNSFVDCGVLNPNAFAAGKDFQSYR